MKKIATTISLFLLLAVFPAQAQTVLFQDPELLLAADKGDFDRINSALVRGENPDTTNVRKETPLIVASKREYIDIIELLLEYNATINWRDTLGNTALFYAVDKSSYETVEFLLENGANPNVANASGVTALMIGALEGDRNIMDLLLAKNPNFSLRDYTGRSIMDYARDSRNRDMEKILQRAGATD